MLDSNYSESEGIGLEGRGLPQPSLRLLLLPPSLSLRLPLLPFFRFILLLLALILFLKSNRGMSSSLDDPDLCCFFISTNLESGESHLSNWESVAGGETIYLALCNCPSSPFLGFHLSILANLRCLA